MRSIAKRVFSNRQTLAVCLGGITVLLALSLSTVRDQLIVDEAIFASTMRSVAQTGVPHYYAGESVGMKSGLWHPPTYIFYITGWFSIFGISSVIARIGTFLLSILTVPAIALLGTTVADTSDEIDTVPVVAAAVLLYVTAPLVVQNGTLVDIDGSILALAVTLFAVWTLNASRYPVRNWFRTLVGVSCWFAVLAWVKFGALPVLLFCLVVYVTLRSGVKRGTEVFIAALIGFFCFGLSWALVSFVFDFSFIEPFAHNFGSLFESGRNISTRKRLLLSAWGFYTEILWLSPFLVGMGLLAVTDRIPTQYSDIKNCTVQLELAFLLAIVLFTILQYAILAKVPYGFPKYLGITTPLLSVLGGVIAVRVLWTAEIRQAMPVLSGLCIIAAIGIYFIGDPFLVSFEAGYSTVIRQTAFTIGGILTIGLFVGLVLLLTDKVDDRRRLVVGFLFIMLLGMNMGIVAQQSTADYSTRYFYGIEGTQETLETTQCVYSDLSVSEQRASVLPVDFGFHIDGPFHATKRYTVSEFESESPPVVVLRIRKYYAVNSPVLDAVSASGEYTVERYGSYAVFRRTSSSTSQNPCLS